MDFTIVEGAFVFIPGAIGLFSVHFSTRFPCSLKQRAQIDPDDETGSTWIIQGNVPISGP